MSRQRFALLLIAALVAISGALYLSTQRNSPREPGSTELFPLLGGEINSVTAVMVRKGSTTPTLTLHKVGEQWSVAQRGDYPADVGKLSKLLMALRDAKIVEEKTANPGQYSVIGVEDPSQPGAAGEEITVVTPSAKHAVIVGKPVGEGSFVRRAGEKQSYSVEPAISLEVEPRFWIDSRLIDVPATLIQSIEVKSPTGTAYTLRRLNSDNTFSLEGVPAGRKPLDGHALAPIPSTLAGLGADDVSSASAIDFNQSSQAIVTLTDGNIITLTGVGVADKRWIEVTSTKDAALTAKTQGRAFEIASYRYEGIFKPLEQLLIPKELPAPKGAAAAKAPSATPARAPKKTPAAAAPAPAP
jgi:Domain of unknown function (DUF4340)